MNIKRIAKVLEAHPDILVRQIALSEAEKRGGVLHGAKAINLQLQPHLRRHTEDYDVLIKKPRKVAQAVLEKLKKYTSKQLSVEKGKHKGTYRVKMNDKVLIDFTQLKRKPKTKKVWGTEVRSLKSIKRHTKRLVGDPKKEFRREKDISTLQRIKEIERMEQAFN